MNISFTRHPLLILLIRWGIGSVFLVAGISKLFPFEGFIQQVLLYHLPMPDQLLYYGAILIISLEIWVGLSIFFGVNLELALLIARLLLLALMPVTIWGALQQAPTCGCYGQLVKRKPWVATVEDSMILAVSFLLPAPPPKASLGLWEKAGQLFFIAAALAGGAYAFIQLNDLLALRSEKLF